MAASEFSRIQSNTAVTRENMLGALGFPQFFGAVEAIPIWTSLFCNRIVNGPEKHKQKLLGSIWIMEKSNNPVLETYTT